MVIQVVLIMFAIGQHIAELRAPKHLIRNTHLWQLVYFLLQTRIKVLDMNPFGAKIGIYLEN